MFSKLVRIGNEPTIRYTPGGDAVLNLSLAYSYGRKGEDGKRPTQWLEAAMWGKQAEGAQPYLHKGDQISVNVDDLHIETYEGKNGPGHKLVGRIVAFDFAANKREGEPIKQPSEAKPEPKPAKGGFDDFKDDLIPF